MRPEFYEKIPRIGVLRRFLADFRRFFEAGSDEKIIKNSLRMSHERRLAFRQRRSPVPFDNAGFQA